MDQVVRARDGYAPRGGDEALQELLDESLDHLPSSSLGVIPVTSLTTLYYLGLKSFWKPSG